MSDDRERPVTAEDLSWSTGLWSNPVTELRGHALLARIDTEAGRDRAERADPSTAGMVRARDDAAAGGRFAEADSMQGLIEATRDRERREWPAREKEQRSRGRGAER